MRIFKALDFWLQVVLLALLAISFFIGDKYNFPPGFFLTAFGGWQALSLLVHLGWLKEPWLKKGWRKVHVLLLVLSLVLVIVAFLQSDAARTGDKDDKYNMAGLGTFALAMFPAAAMAILYIVISGAEWLRSRK